MSGSDLDLGDSDGQNTLVLAPPFDEDRRDSCLDLLSGADAEGQQVLRVSYTRSAEEVVDEWRDHLGELPALTYVVTVESGVQNSGTTRDVVDGREVVVAPANPNDLTGLGMRLTRFMNQNYDPTAELYVCFDSVTALLQYVDLESGYKFLNMVTSQFRQADATSHFHLNPTAHDDQTVSTLKTLFTDLERPGEE